MERKRQSGVEISHALIEAIRTFPIRRKVVHCGAAFRVSPFDIDALCPRCGIRFQVRSVSGGTELEDVFDAVFEWMNQPETRSIVEKRQQEIADDE